MKELESQNFQPKISVLIPVYNVEKYIERCIRSLLANTVIKDCEVIIVDDCSPDNSIEIVKNILKEVSDLKEKFILCSHDCNRGLAAARNTALLQAHGKYIICVDSDDWVEKDYLEQLYNCAEKNNADVVMCNLIKETKGSSEIIIEKARSNNYVMDLLMGNLHGWLPEKLIKLSFLREHNINWIEGLNMCEDLLIMTKVFYFAKKIIHLDKALYHYDCTNESSLSASLNENKINQLINVVKEIENFLPETYKEEIKSQKSNTKIWIVKCAENLNSKLLNLYNESKLYKVKNLPLFIRLFHFFCYIHFYFAAKIMVKVRNKK